MLVGTIFEDTKLPLPKWFMAIALILNAKKGISSRQLSRDLGINRNTAWYLQMRIRQVMQEKDDQDDDQQGLLQGIVEVDETYLGGQMRNHSKQQRQQRRENQAQITGMQHKQPVVGLLEREGKVIMKVLEKAHGKAIQPIVEQTVSKQATVVTDGFGGYAALNKHVKSHQVLNHQKEEYRRGDYHTNTIEGLWTLLKRGIYGQYHKVSAKHLQRYLNEFTFKYNHRGQKNVFDTLITKGLNKLELIPVNS